MAKKIRVLFDASPLVRQKTGVGFYTEGLIKALSEIDELELAGYYFRPRGARPELPTAANLSFRSSPWLVGLLAKGLRKIGVRLPWELLAWARADILLFPDFTTWPSLFRTPKILTVHDLTYIDHPEHVRRRNLRYLRRYVRRDAKKAQLVLTISRFSKDRIIKTFGLPASKVRVEPIPPAQPVTGAKPSWLPKHFILFISTIEPRKNVNGLVDAYLYLPDKLRQKYALIIAGGSGWDSDEVMERIHHLQKDGVQILTPGYVNEAVRAGLYKNASVVVVPSFYEGFGMPILEAFAYGAPVVASNLSVLKEIGADAALYFDPASPKDMQIVIEKVLSDTGLQKSLAEKGKQEAANYSWQKVARDLYNQIEKLAR